MYFQDTLKQMRGLDDKIVYALNVRVPTPSFREEINPAQTCRELYDEVSKLSNCALFVNRIYHSSLLKGFIL